jgi:hypothetical protein
MGDKEIPRVLGSVLAGKACIGVTHGRPWGRNTQILTILILPDDVKCRGG